MTLTCDWFQVSGEVDLVGVVRKSEKVSIAPVSQSVTLSPDLAFILYIYFSLYFSLYFYSKDTIFITFYLRENTDLQ